MILLFIIIILFSSCSNLSSQSILPSGNWSLVSSNDSKDEYYQIRVNAHYIDRLFAHGILRDSNLVQKDEVIFSNEYKVHIKLLEGDKLQISDGKTIHILRKIKSDCYCFCIDGNYQSERFAYQIRQIQPNDTTSIIKLKNEMWDFFQGDIIYKNNNIKDFNFKIKPKHNE